MYAYFKCLFYLNFIRVVNWVQFLSAALVKQLKASHYFFFYCPLISVSFLSRGSTSSANLIARQASFFQLLTWSLPSKSRDRLYQQLILFICKSVHCNNQTIMRWKDVGRFCVAEVHWIASTIWEWTRAEKKLWAYWTNTTFFLSHQMLIAFFLH